MHTSDGKVYTIDHKSEQPQYDFGEYKLICKTASQPSSPILAPECSENDTPIDSSIATTSPSATLRPAPTKVECIVRARIPTTLGVDVWLHVYKNNADNKDHLAIVFGNRIRSHTLDRVSDGETEMERMIRGAYTGRLQPGRINSRSDEPYYQPNTSTSPAKATPSSSSSLPSSSVLVRVHSECYTGETVWSARCDCGEQLDEAARAMAAVGEGVIVYLRQEGRGIGLADKLKAYNLQDLGLDSVDANLFLGRPVDARVYGIATAILLDLGLGENAGTSRRIRLLTNNPAKFNAIQGELPVQDRVPMIPVAWQTNGVGNMSLELQHYIRTKVDKMGHLIGNDDVTS